MFPQMEHEEEIWCEWVKTHKNNEINEIVNGRIEQNEGQSINEIKGIITCIFLIWKMFKYLKF